MSKETKDLQDLLAKSIEALRASPAEREKYPALDRLLGRIEARQRRSSDRASAWGWMRPLLGPLSSAAAGFVGAALAMMLLPAWFGGAPAPAAPSAVVARHQAAEPARMMSHSLHRLERAIHGLEKFQPLIESRIEALEDAFQRKYADAYATGEDVSRSQDPYKNVQMRQDRGAFF